MKTFLRDARSLKGPAALIWAGAVGAVWAGCAQVTDASTDGRPIRWDMAISWLFVLVAFLCTAVMVGRLEQGLNALKDELEGLRDQQDG